MTTAWSHRYARRTQRLASSTIRELLKLTQQPEVISFAGGLPAPELFPIREFEYACRRVLTERGQAALQYSTTEGYPPLREMIARHTARYGIPAGPENVLVTSGSQTTPMASSATKATTFHRCSCSIAPRGVFGATTVTTTAMSFT